MQSQERVRSFARLVPPETYTISRAALNSQQNLHSRKELLPSSVIPTRIILSRFEIIAPIPGARVKRIRSLISHCLVLSVAQQNGGAQITHGEKLRRPAFGIHRSILRGARSMQHEGERKFPDGIVRDNLHENMRRISAGPHQVGAAYDQDNAEWILSKFKQWDSMPKSKRFGFYSPLPKSAS
jgi:hypothetical protein